VPTATPTPAPIVVDVGGAVRQPGVLLLPPGARVVDAVAAAGGLTAEADALQLNQAARLFDGAQVYVPALGASSALPPAGLSGTPSTPASDSPQPARGLVDLNTATQAELEALPGIGATKAQAILANRPYATVAELDRVPGIGSATIQQLQEWVVVGP
jgi:competence protein ComEA